MDLQKFFNSFDPRLSPKTIRLMHGSLRTALTQAVVWELIPKNPAVGVKLPRRKVRKPPLVLSLPDIRRMIEAVPEPSKSLVTLIVFASLRVGEVLGLRWKRVKSDRLHPVVSCPSLALESASAVPIPAVCPAGLHVCARRGRIRSWSGISCRQDSGKSFAPTSGTSNFRRYATGTFAR